MLRFNSNLSFLNLVKTLLTMSFKIMISSSGVMKGINEKGSPILEIFKTSGSQGSHFFLFNTLLNNTVESNEADVTRVT